jgi:hypothetical protein
MAPAARPAPLDSALPAWSIENIEERLERLYGGGLVAVTLQDGSVHRLTPYEIELFRRTADDTRHRERPYQIAELERLAVLSAAIARAT